MKPIVHTAKSKEATNVRLDRELKLRIGAIAQSNQISLSDAVRFALIRFLPEMESGTFTLRAPAHSRAANGKSHA